MDREDRSLGRSEGRAQRAMARWERYEDKCLINDQQRDMGNERDIRTLITLGTKPKATELLALSFTTQVEGVGELALVAFLAKSTLIMFADEMTDSRSLVRRSVVTVRTGRAQRTVTVLVGSACRTVVLVREAEGRESSLEIGQEGQFGGRGAGRVENAVSDGSGHGGRRCSEQRRLACT